MKIARRRDGWSEMFVADEPWDPAYAERFADGTCDGLVVGAPTRAKSAPAVDLAFLPDLVGLRSLRILNGLPDLSPVARCAGLERLRLPASTTGELDLSALSRLRELEAPWPVVARSLPLLAALDDLVLPEWKGASLSALGPQPALRALRLETTRKHVTDMEGAALFPALRELRLYDGRLDHPELLAGATALEDVSLLSARTDSIAFVSGLPRLRRLELENCGDIASLAPVADRAALREVILSGSTRVADGDLSPLLANTHLAFVAVERGHAHYSHPPREVRKG
ncbi:hypothetical protein [Streptomyces sp. NRRL F-5727]|uniref:hypothetical protein n=1 Tax=Streptomyces sp. NRRL F-5727 TaxID=1463871 RepID=UPI0004CC8129|nr:hypothetical protein [Streptomyces sp. NRRL F-5727]